MLQNIKKSKIPSETVSTHNHTNSDLPKTLLKNEIKPILKTRGVSSMGVDTIASNHSGFLQKSNLKKRPLSGMLDMTL